MAKTNIDALKGFGFRETLNRVSQVTLDGGYQFKLYPFGEKGNYIDIALFNEIEEWFVQLDLVFTEGDVDELYLAAPEPGGLPWAFSLVKALKFRGVIPLRLERDYHLLPIQNKYSEKRIDCGVHGNGESVILFDDVISSGKTLEQNIGLLRTRGFKVEHVLIICSKDKSVVSYIEKKYKVSIHVFLYDI